MSIVINKAGFLTTIQDGGRTGYAHIGIPKSGFMDRLAAHVANKMLENDPNAALLEVDVVGIILTTEVDCSVAIAGAKAIVHINQEPNDTTQPIHLKQGDQLEIKPLTQGMWTYLAFAGGLCCESVLGSCSTLTVAKLGGYEGRRLYNNDRIILQAPRHIHGQKKPMYKRPPHNTIHCLAATAGPEFDLFTKAAQRQIFQTAFTMTEHISRQGMKITGVKLDIKTKTDVHSTGLVPGSLQVTPGGEYIVTHRDSQTTGGYPRPIILNQQALNQLAQVRPGEQIYFYKDL
ncbi:5-oxoprolinase subunit C family protein [Marinicella gelatinilytica]|uniref:5-oxoprolinase subunit C family protein n=1 Tax=Marinicella gelatinilytica TaxID=2996017 RepID=UPI002260F223|nr:biotin-dependent carboxyltransferase family protein [Marinicella gelatinilytica]MCX7545032.1 biotin-dependent carboxyltransferase family protein [Marinicella gelatinilytica]